MSGWKIRWDVEKFDADAIDLVDPETRLWVPRRAPFEVVRIPGNLLLNAGIQRLEDLLIGAGGQALNNANSRIGIGNSNTAASASQTDLQAASGAGNRQFEVMDSTFPSRASQTISWKSTFATGEGNFAVEEVGVDAGTAAATTVTAPLLNRKVSSLGTKTSAQVWQVTATLVIS